MSIFSTSYTLEGNLKRWGMFRFKDIYPCQHFPEKDVLRRTMTRTLADAIVYSCTLTLEDIIDWTTTSGNNNFITLFLNFTQSQQGTSTLLQTIPVLIKNLTNANNVSVFSIFSALRIFSVLRIFYY